VLERLHRSNSSTIRRSIRYWLEHPPAPDVFTTSASIIVFDGSMLDKRRGPYVALDGQTNTVIAAENDIAENGRELLPFYQKLLNAGITPEYAIIDGNSQETKYLKIVWPQIIIQRCIVHVQRQGLQWCRRRPKRTDAKHLRMLFLDLSSIKTIEQVQKYLQQVEQWEKRFGTRIRQFPERGPVFSDIKRARSMLLNALPSLFHFIADPRVPSSTNAVEGYFSRLKELYRSHRGLSRAHRRGFFLWYFYLVRR
jgi:hypothetical protein